MRSIISIAFLDTLQQKETIEAMKDQEPKPLDLPTTLLSLNQYVIFTTPPPNSDFPLAVHGPHKEIRWKSKNHIPLAFALDQYWVIDKQTSRPPPTPILRELGQVRCRFCPRAP